MTPQVELDPVKQAFHAFVRERGMQKRGTQWYARSDDVVQVCHLERSNWGPMYHVDVCFWLNALGHEPFPTYFKCHVVARGCDWSSELRPLLDLDVPLDADTRRAQLDRQLRTVVGPVLETATTLAGLRDLYARGEFKKALVHKHAKPLLQQAA